jgi:hypothetical protein
MDSTGVRRPGLLCRFGSKVLVEAPCWFLLKAGVVVFLENLNSHQAFRDVSWSAPLMVPWVSSFLVTGGRVLWITDLLDRRALGACLNQDWLTG